MTIPLLKETMETSAYSMYMYMYMYIQPPVNKDTLMTLLSVECVIEHLHEVSLFSCTGICLTRLTTVMCLHDLCLKGVS